VNVEVEFGLPRVGAAAVEQVDTVGAEPVLGPLGDLLGQQCARGEVVFCDVEQI
jgi:hypothetical protein